VVLGLFYAVRTIAAPLRIPRYIIHPSPITTTTPISNPDNKPKHPQPHDQAQIYIIQSNSPSIIHIPPCPCSFFFPCPPSIHNMQRYRDTYNTIHQKKAKKSKKAKKAKKRRHVLKTVVRK
jgi:hypothetical protein